MINLTLENIKKYLATKDYSFEVQKETDQLHAVLKFQGASYPLFIRIFERSDMLQLLLFLPCTIKEGCQSELARLLHRINKEVDVPGYGMDESSNVVFYRFMLPGYKGQIEETGILSYLRSLEKLCDTFTVPIVAVAQGRLTFQAILDQLNSPT